MTWIVYRRREAIPDYLLYPGCQTSKDKNGNTALMHWIMYRKGKAIP